MSITSSLKLSISKDLDDRLKSILSGLYSINNGIANLRNISGDAHAKKFKPLSHHAQLAVNCAFTFSQFLCDTY
jgi:TctA family transporter